MFNSFVTNIIQLKVFYMHVYKKELFITLFIIAVEVVLGT